MNELEPQTETDRRLHHKDLVIAEYLGNLQTGEQEAAELMARDIVDTKKPLADTISIIPVAADQDGHLIPHALRQLALQNTLEPASIVLGINADLDKVGLDSNCIERCMGRAAEARKLYPALDIRATYMNYSTPTIGMIRRDVWNAVLTARALQGNISATKEIIGINHDIDVVHIPRRYTSAIQRRFKHPARALSAVYTQIRHSYDPMHPNISKQLSWFDFYNDQMDLGYEAGSAIPMTVYATRGGIDPTKRVNEMNSLMADNHSRRRLRTGYLLTSPRRFVDRLPTHGVESIWTPDSFSSKDTCREPSVVEALPDIPYETVYAYLCKVVRNDLYEMFDHRFELASINQRTELSIAALLKPTSPEPAIAGELRAIAHREQSRLWRLAQFILKAGTRDGYPVPYIDAKAFQGVVQERAEGPVRGMHFLQRLVRSDAS